MLFNYDLFTNSCKICDKTRPGDSTLGRLCCRLTVGAGSHHYPDLGILVISHSGAHGCAAGPRPKVCAEPQLVQHFVATGEKNEKKKLR